ncbi:MAG: universal stress protein [Acidobacteriaceae bacterium]|nr:universal stress protein [Acidobacteriaceae bacterium]
MAIVVERKPTPEQLLQQVESDENFQSRGRLKIFLGYASGVGKSFRMIDEGRRRHERGQDVVIGAIQPNLAPEVQHILADLEQIPLKDVNGRAVIDVPRILERHPKVCLIDGLAYDNPPGSLHEKRWQDVEQLLDAGISVITSVNLQNIEEKRAQVEAITGKHVDETMPLSFLQTADEIVVVDIPPESCMRVEEAKNGTRHRLTQLQLSELREIALLLAADVVDKQLERYLARHGIEQLWGTQERILVCLTPNADAQRMLESAVRNRDRFHGELIAVNLNRAEWSAEQRAKVQHGLELAKEKNAEIADLDGEDPVDTLLRFARQRGITQMYVGQKGREGWWERAFGTDLDRLIRSAEGIDVRVFPHS